MRLHIDLYAVFIEKIDNFCIRYYRRFLFDIVLSASGRGWVFRGSCLFEDKKKSSQTLITRLLGNIHLLEVNRFAHLPTGGTFPNFSQGTFRTFSTAENTDHHFYID